MIIKCPFQISRLPKDKISEIEEKLVKSLKVAIFDEFYSFRDTYGKQDLERIQAYFRLWKLKNDVKELETLNRALAQVIIIVRLSHFLKCCR